MANDSTDNPSTPDDRDSERVRGRRSFFRQLFLKGMDKAEAAGQDVARRFEFLNEYIEEKPPPYVPINDIEPYSFEDDMEEDDDWLDEPRLLRPPGALADPDLAEVCSRCGDCAKACPADCIIVDPEVDAGLPHIIARTSPCVVCDDLSCMKVCPTGALNLVDMVEDIHMGFAQMNYDRCVREPVDSDEPGEDCDLCVQQCPLGEKAIMLDEDGLVEVRAGCIGCGVCERACPTEPASIHVEPYY